MRRSWSNPAWLILMCLTLLAAACNPVVVITQTTPETAPSASPSQIPPTLLPPIPTTESLPSETPTTTSVLPAVSTIPTSFEGPGAWDLRHPYADPGAPDYFIEDQYGYHLDANFQLASIDLAYRWMGIGDQVRDYQRIERHEDGFWRDGTEIPASAVENLIQALTHLHPQPLMLSATTHTDDYPTWIIELTDLGGNPILLYSESNTPGYAPWNVVYNGAIYTQFDGGIATALSDLFDVVEGQTLASTWGPALEEGYLTVVPIENPQPLTHGFSRLIPLYKDFSYQPDAQSGELRGRISGFDWSTEFGDTRISWLSDLERVELILEDGKTIDCPLEVIPGDDPQYVNQTFTCRLGTPMANPAYSYTIQLTYTNPQGKSYIRTGKLYGYWETATILPVFTLPGEIAAILEDSAASSDLVREHQVVVLDAIGAVDPSTGSQVHRWQAEIALLGQVDTGEQALPYSLTLHHVTIEAGELTHWDIDRGELQALLGDALRQPITQRFIAQDPGLILNLFYIEESSYAIISDEYYDPCPQLPPVGDLPVAGKPVRGFSFNSLLETWAMQLFLVDDQVRIKHLYVDLSTPQGIIWASLLPDELRPVNAPLYRQVRNTYGGAGVSVYWEIDTSQADIQVYKALLDSWGVETSEHTYDPAITFEQVTLDLTPDGRLRLVDCRMP